MEEGLILKGVGGFYEVLLPSGERLVCRARGVFRKRGETPLAGDRVRLRRVAEGGGVLDSLLPRSNAFCRPPICNVSRLAIVACETTPRTDPYLIDHMAAAAVHRGVSPLLVVNKIDVSDEGRLRGIYASAGFPLFLVSAKTGDGVEELKAALAGEITVLGGNSGAGKSALLGRIDPEGSYKTGEVSEKLGRGRHTTRHVELFHLPGNVVVADTPGFAALDSAEHIPSDALGACFLDFAPFLNGCRFRGCLHETDLGCAVREAAENGGIHPVRYQSYLRMLGETRQSRQGNYKKGEGR